MFYTLVRLKPVFIRRCALNELIHVIVFDTQGRLVVSVTNGSGSGSGVVVRRPPALVLQRVSVRIFVVVIKLRRPRTRTAATTAGSGGAGAASVRIGALPAVVVCRCVLLVRAIVAAVVCALLLPPPCVLLLLLLLLLTVVIAALLVPILLCPAILALARLRILALAVVHRLRATVVGALRVLRLAVRAARPGRVPLVLIVLLLLLLLRGCIAAVRAIARALAPTHAALRAHRALRHLRGGFVVHNSRHHHLDRQPLTLLRLAREDERLPALAEVHAEVDAEPVAQLKE